MRETVQQVKSLPLEVLTRLSCSHSPNKFLTILSGLKIHRNPPNLTIMKQIIVACIILHFCASTFATESDFLRDRNDSLPWNRSIMKHLSGIELASPPRRASLQKADLTKHEPSEISGRYIASKNVSSHLAYIVVYHNGGGSTNCSGTILASKIVLTAARCFHREDGTYDISHGWVRIGQYSSSGKIYPFKYVDVHANYDYKTSRFDIAIIRVLAPFDLPYSTVNIPNTKDKLPLKSIVYVAGFGQALFDGSQSTTALEAKLQYQPFRRCKRQFSESFNAFWSSKRLICATDPRFPKSGGAGPCSGNTGSPLYLKSGSGLFQVGIMSLVLECGAKRSAGIYSKLSFFSSDILSNAVEKVYTNWVEIYNMRK